MNLRQIFGQTVFWSLWPIWYLYLRGSLRTRVLVVCGRRVLVVKEWHGGGKWSLPGGGVHHGEPLKKSATRELYEETDIALLPQKLVSLGQSGIKLHGIPFRIARYVVRIPRALPANPKSLEISRAEWMATKELDSNNAEPIVLELIALWKQRR